MKNSHNQISTFIWSTEHMTFAPLNLKEKVQGFVKIIRVLVETHPLYRNMAIM